MTTTKRRGHGEGSICKRKDGLWVARVTLPGGKRKPFYGKTRKEAADRLKQAQKAIDDGLSLDGDRQTLAQFLHKCLALSVKPSVKVRTYENYESIVRVRVVPRIGEKRLSKLTVTRLSRTCTPSSPSPDSRHVLSITPIAYCIARSVRR